MSAFHVVRPDEQRGLGIHFGVRRQQQILVGLRGVRLDRAFSDEHRAAEHGARAPGQDALVVQRARGVGLGVVYVDEVVHVLRAGGDVQPVEFRLAAVADEGVEVVPAEADAPVESAGGEGAAVHLADARHAHVVGGVALVHESVVVKARALFHQNLGDAVVEIGVFAKPDVAFDDGGFRFRAGDDEDARMGGEIAFAVGDEGEMDGALDPRAGRDADHRAVRDEGGVERGEAVVFGARQAAQPTADEVGGFAVAVYRARKAGYGRAVRLAQVG